MVNEDVFACVAAINEAVSALHVNLLNGSNHSLMLVTAYVDKAGQDVIEFAPCQLTIAFSNPLR